jgi:uncharacterized repeat protein (TIGR03803 family)
MEHPAAAQSPRYETLYSFKGTPDGADPKGALLIGKFGELYGTTFAGGTSVLGTVFMLAPHAGQPWKETILHNFTGSDGQYPQSALTHGNNGEFYGVTVGGGPGGPGAIFELAPPTTSGGAWTETVLYGFAYGPGSQNLAPNGPVLIGQGGTLYTTTQGQSPYLGLVLALAPPSTPGGDWTEYGLYHFGGGTDGGGPAAGLVSSGGSLFGTTTDGGNEGGDNGCGVVFQVAPGLTHSTAWIETVLHTFTCYPGDGEIPYALLTVGPGGVLYGTTRQGGSSQCYTANVTTGGCGTVFELAPPSTTGGAWTYSVIYNFTGANGDGAAPVSAVVLGKNGAIYGTTSSAGSATSDSACPASYYVIGGCGIVFELTPPTTPNGAWTETVLHSFSGANGDGAIPVAGLALSPTGILYGTTTAGGAAGRGTVFAVAP